MIPKEIVENEAGKNGLGGNLELTYELGFVNGASFAQEYLAEQAARFAEWIHENMYARDGKVWVTVKNAPHPYTTEELFKLFLEQDKP